MSFWEPKWVRKELKSHGISITTCYDITTSLIICPICSAVRIEELCPENREGNLPIADIPLFASIDDLIYHMRTHWHTKRYKKMRVSAERERSEESKESVLGKFTDIKYSGRRK
ncbi:MAG: hypothetical protein RMI56_05870 [Sulfolobales archaeon]|nr:hypothetical protein [Sulfolobales archaeon]MDW8083303.1 hypothetical protein [Sulfolobales archaeon]